MGHAQSPPCYTQSWCHALPLCLIPFGEFWSTGNPISSNKMWKGPIWSKVLINLHVTIQDECKVGVKGQANQMVWLLPWLFFSCCFELPSPGCLLHAAWLCGAVCCLFEIIPFSGDSSRTVPFCTSPITYSIIQPPIEGESASIKKFELVFIWLLYWL